MYRVELVPALQLPLVNKFYKRSGDSARAGRGEQVYVLRSVEGIVAALRLQPAEAGWVFLRSMCVAPEQRREGLGSLLLRQLAPVLAQQPVYCYPFDHLEDFYARAGFVRLDPDTAAEHIRTALLRYQRQGRKIILMTYNAAL